MSELSKVDIYRQIDVLRQSLLDLTMRNQLLNFRPRSMTVEVKEGEIAEIYDRLVLKKSKRKLLQFIPRGESEGTSQPTSSTYRTTSFNEYNDVENLDLTEKDDNEKESLISVESIKIVNEEVLSSSTVSDERKADESLKVDVQDDLSDIETNDFPDTNGTTEGLAPDESSLLWESPSLDQETLEKNKEIFLSTELSPSELQRRLFYINQRARSMMEEQGYNILYLAMGFLKWQESNGTPEIVKHH